MSARGKRSDAAAERRPGLPIDGLPIDLKGRNRRRTLVSEFPSVSFIGLSWCCSVPCSSTVRDIPWLIARFHVALQPSPTLMISSGHARPSGLAFVAPFQGFVTRFDSQPRATQPLVELADARPGLTCCGPFRAVRTDLCDLGNRILRSGAAKVQPNSHSPARAMLTMLAGMCGTMMACPREPHVRRYIEGRFPHPLRSSFLCVATFGLSN